MVVSGLPIRNGDLHAGEIASVSLDLLSSMCDFKIRHMPGTILQLRIGMHSGRSNCLLLSVMIIYYERKSALDCEKWVKSNHPLHISHIGLVG